MRLGVGLGWNVCAAADQPDLPAVPQLWSRSRPLGKIALGYTRSASLDLAGVADAEGGWR